MAAGQYVSALNQSPLDKITSAAAPAMSVAQGVNSVAVDLTQKLLGAGASFGAISSSVTTGLDNISSNLRGETTSLTQTMMTRQSPADLISSRKDSVDNVEKFSSSHMPTRKIADAKVKESKTQMLMYPLDLRKYYINFAFGSYERPNPYERQNMFSPTLNIALPMPSTLLDPSGVKLKPTELGGVLGQGVENVAGLVQSLKSGEAMNLNNSKGFLDAAKRTTNQGIGTLYNVVYETASIVPGLDDIAATAGQLLGAVPNPHVTVFFQGVDLRAHSFTWRFAPKNPAESIYVQTIIREFKKRMLPNYKWGEANVLGYPEMVQITLEPDMSDVLYKFKKCMISSVNVNYSPNGIPSFFAGTRHPTAIEFQVNFQELEILTSQDYGGENGDAAGAIVSSLKDGLSKTASLLSAENLGGQGFGG